MKILGLIAEYNPFHNGHLYHLNESKRKTSSTHVVVVMSGNFVQRGEPAIINKYARTKMALLNGADLVIELPVFYATASAEYFAYGSVGLLNSTGIVDCLCFGSESGELNTLKRISDILSNEPDNFKICLAQQLKKGISFPVARQNALHEISDFEQDFLASPNNILAIEYLKAINKIKSKIEPYTIKRKISSYNSTQLSGEISSATSIRKAIFENKNIDEILKSMPNNCTEIMVEHEKSNLSPIRLNDFSNIFHYIIRKSNIDELKNILDITEGLENRITKYAEKNFFLDDIISEIKTKRYTITKIQRAMIHILLNIKVSDLDYYLQNKSFGYIRVLGLRKESSFLLNELQNNANLPIVTKTREAIKQLDKPSCEMLQKEIESTDIYNLACTNNSMKTFQKSLEHSMPLVIV